MVSLGDTQYLKERSKLRGVYVQNPQSYNLLAYNPTLGKWSNIATPYYPDPMISEGDMLYYHNGAPTRLPIGTNNKMMLSNGLDPVWATVPYNPDPMTTEGDMLYEHNGLPTRMAIGSNGQWIRSNGTVPLWDTPKIGSSLTGTITTSNLDVVDQTGVVNAPAGEYGGALWTVNNKGIMTGIKSWKYYGVMWSQTQNTVTAGGGFTVKADNLVAGLPFYNNGGYLNTSTGVYTVQVGGLYLLSITAVFGTNVTGTFRGAIVTPTPNGVAQNFGQRTPVVSTVSASVTQEYPLSPSTGDTIVFQVQHDATSSLTVTCHCRIWLIGRDPTDN